MPRQTLTSPYVLIRTGQEPSRVVEYFRPGDAEYYSTPRGFTAVIGPFETRFAAKLMAENPHLESIQQCESLACNLLAQAQRAIAEDSPIAHAVAASNGQNFGDAKDTPIFQEAVARKLFTMRTIKMDALALRSNL